MNPRHLVLATALLLTAPAAFGAPRDPAAAEALFNQARTLMEKRDFIGACAKFEESFRLDPAAGTLMNQADCEEKRGRIATAWGLWNGALDMLQGDDRLDYARERVAALVAQVPKLTLTFDGTLPPGTTIVRNNVPLSSAVIGAPLPVDPGSQAVAVRAPGYKEWSMLLAVKPGEKRTIAIRLGQPVGPVATPVPTSAPVTPSAPAANPSASPLSVSIPSPADSSGGFSQRTLGFVVGGLGIASLGAGVVTAILAHGKGSDYEAACPNGSCPNDAALEDANAAADAGRTLNTVSIATFAAGAVATGAGLFLVITAPSGEPQSAFTVVPQENGARAVWSGHF